MSNVIQDTAVYQSVLHDLDSKIFSQKKQIELFDKQIADNSRPAELREDDIKYRAKYAYRLSLYEKMRAALYQ